MTKNMKNYKTYGKKIIVKADYSDASKTTIAIPDSVKSDLINPGKVLKCIVLAIGSDVTLNVTVGDYVYISKNAGIDIATVDKAKIGDYVRVIAETDLLMTVTD